MALLIMMFLMHMRYEYANEQHGTVGEGHLLKISCAAMWPWLEPDHDWSSGWIILMNMNMMNMTVMMIHIEMVNIVV